MNGKGLVTTIYYGVALVTLVSVGVLIGLGL